MNEESERRTASFGVGCFHFTTSSNDSIEVGEYIEKLKGSLNNITNVSELSIFGYESFAFHPFGDGVWFFRNQNDRIIQRSNIDQSLDNGIGLFPHPIDSRVTFRLYIPTRFQKEIMENGWSAESEHLHISIYYTDRFPVTIISEVGDEHTSDPSKLVILVRRFLENAFKDKNGPILFESLGPSPFHADFFLVEGLDSSTGIIFSKLGSGYDLIEIESPENAIEPQHLHNHAISMLGTETALYYATVQNLNSQSRIHTTLRNQIFLAREQITSRSFFIGN